MNEKILKEKFDKVISDIKVDYATNKKPFDDGIQPFIDMLLALAFYIYKTGFEDGMISKELENESQDI
jgi:hypothetical protein